VKILPAQAAKRLVLWQDSCPAGSGAKRLAERRSERPMARGSVIKRGDTYSIVYRIGGKQKWEVIGPTKREADKALTEKLAELNKAPYRELKKIAFRDFAHKWLVDYAEGKVKPGTLDHYQRVVKVHLVPYFGEVPLRQISPELVQGYISAKKAEGKLTPKTINNSLVPLKEMFKHAVRWGYLRENPALYVEKPRVERREMDFLKPEEIRLFLLPRSVLTSPRFFSARS
jgi:hypothetical protein